MKEHRTKEDGEVGYICSVMLDPLQQVATALVLLYADAEFHERQQAGDGGEGMTQRTFAIIDMPMLEAAEAPVGARDIPGRPAVQQPGLHDPRWECVADEEQSGDAPRG